MYNHPTSTLQERVSTDDGPELTIKGTNLITFERVTIINGTKYSNHKGVLKKMPGIASSPLLKIIGHGKILSLPLLHRMNEQNGRSIQEL